MQHPCVIVCLVHFLTVQCYGIDIHLLRQLQPELKSTQVKGRNIYVASQFIQIWCIQKHILQITNPEFIKKWLVWVFGGNNNYCSPIFICTWNLVPSLIITYILLHICISLPKLHFISSFSYCCCSSDICKYSNILRKKFSTRGIKVPLYWGNYIGADIYSEILEQIYIQKFFINKY